ncbi:MAG: hypothetical protein KBB94_06110 [Legionellaceae bacterium]|nr:hypothetical protein [Legionellaceae bacterium]MBP9775906.1 hypothetical protein [Legionellaceae bacterium]
MHAPNDELIANITKQLADLRQIDHVLAAANLREYLIRYEQFKREYLQRGYQRGEHHTWDLLLDNFDFAGNRMDPRTHKMHQAFDVCHGAQTEEQSSPSFFHLLYVTFQSIHDKKITTTSQCHRVRQLIAAQITIVEQRMKDITRPISQESHIGAQHNQEGPLVLEINQPPSRPIVHASPYFLSLNKTIAAAGCGLMGGSLLLHLNPTFALMVGIHLSPAMFVVLVVAGACMAGYGLSRKEPPRANTGTPVLQSPFYGRQIEQFLKFCFSFGRSGNRVALDSLPASQSTTPRYAPNT